MKELETRLPEIPADKIETVVQVEKKRIHQARIMHKPGTQIWEFDLERLRLRIASMDVSADIKGNIKRRVEMRPGCLYIQALNVKNALRKFEKQTGIKLHYQPIKEVNHGK